ncbi:translation initiation factor eIF-1A [Candidatus Pacearchaeota archaeon]|nr:translation initiation factor eIF-1A [Candidatus Pacearchaeota archaeon]
MNNRNNNEESEEIVTRVRLPKGEETIGIIESRLGGNKMMVRCLDGKNRNCRIPGRLKRKLWLRPGDVVIVELWEFEKDKGDVIFKYRPNQVEWLKRNGYLENESVEF